MDNEIRNLRGIVLRYEKGSMEDADRHLHERMSTALLVVFDAGISSL